MFLLIKTPRTAATVIRVVYQYCLLLYTVFGIFAGFTYEWVLAVEKVCRRLRLSQLFFKTSCHPNNLAYVLQFCGEM